MAMLQAHQQLLSPQHRIHGHSGSVSNSHQGSSSTAFVRIQSAPASSALQQLHGSMAFACEILNKTDRMGSIPDTLAASSQNNGKRLLVVGLLLDSQC